MQIPKSFKLLGNTIEVEFDPSMVNAADAVGEAHYRFNKIKLQGVEGYVGRPQSKIEQSFCHELTHFLLFFSECSDTKELYKNELVVDRIAGLLHQALTTAEYE
jgi:hypothetical protein